ncbi:glycosyl hydrolases family 15-domain-containing protein [Absidia repens]|uniref:Glycosyl hydrolases family 15-domain-containing protein n=1 Tax=Absidia repens TaxID=90262 RepID=A0A1X2I266_9FUNG|nr:glycosyl hydrolases family 15-domain-containing protein [Absidia repens]
MPFGRKKRVSERLDYYYKVINTTILSKQNAASGLIPASVAITSHGDYTDAWVRDNVYSIYAVYGLALAYRRLDDDTGRTFELEHAVVKLMRGLLFSMMRQSAKVEKFKKSQHILDALHAKYKTETGATVVGDSDWGHLQIDATSLFLVALADMTSSGLHIVYTQDEVDFVQNLVFYIERAYRTPDFGIWERGDKTNNGQPELNSSSIGMAVAALQAINGVNLFGARGGPASVIYVLPDELTRNATTLKSFLPRESNSKEIDGSVLSVIGFPAFAVDDPALIELTRKEAKEKLEGRYGWKRFLRDGHQTSVEDTTRLHYNNSELKIFENIESEWPLFFTYLVLEGLFTGDHDQVEEYRNKLKRVVIDSGDWDPENPKAPACNGDDTGPTLRTDNDNTLHIPLVPELYFVPAESIDAERSNPNTQDRTPNDNTPLVWALSLYLLGNLIYEGLLSPSEMDPLGRRYNVQKQKPDTMTQIVLLAEDEELQSALATYGLETQTVSQISQRFTILPPRALADVYHSLGHNTKLGLTGRPKRPVGVLGTSRLYRMEGHIYAFTPYFMDNEAFYLNADPDLLVSTFESELAFARDNWAFPGRPTLTVVLTKEMIMGTLGKDLSFPTDASRKNLLNFFMNLRSGMCNNGVRVRLCRLAESLNTSNIASLDFLLEKAMDDWQTILSNHKLGKSSSDRRRRLGFNEYQTQASTPGAPGTPKRRSTSFYGKALGTPLDKLHDEGYFQDIADVLENMDKNQEPVFRLKDHEGGSPKIASEQLSSNPTASATPPKVEITNNANTNSGTNTPCDEPGSYFENALSLTLGDHTQFNEAITSLKGSVNLYDQIDLLHYLVSCEGIDYYIGDLQATTRSLLEEVYLKAVHLQYWSIARQASGLLRKVVPSLTINITDLVIRQKQISIGSGQHEYLISRPVGPDAVGEMISKHCTDDVREGPVVQEILIYLGGFIRTNPSMFDGILRLRTHYIIIALREEIRRINDCNEEEAIEHLMQLSPFELQSLLGTILSGPSLCKDADVLVRDRAAGLLMLNQEEDDTVVIRAQSAGYCDGNFAKVDINGNTMIANSRGLHVWAVDRHDKLVLEQASFDTHISSAESDNFVNFINWLKDGMILAVVARDDFTEHLSSGAVDTLEALGGKSIRNVKYRDSYVLITEKGDPGSAIEEHKQTTQGPTKMIERHFSTKTEKPKNEEITEKNIHRLSPTSKGRWLRRRMNDGALNRVPDDFFPQTWMVLDKCHGIVIGTHCLPRDPTVFDKTPGEFNFALAVESFLGWFTDPAQRQIAVEILSLTYESVQQQRLDVGQLMQGNVDIPAIMEDAQASFWSNWVNKNKDELALSPLFKDNRFGYDDHKDLAKQLFYDLPLDGTDSTRSYLTKSLEHLLPKS